MAKNRVQSFDIPTQVAFKCEDTEGAWMGGIGYGDVIICGCCGTTFPIDEIYEDNGEIHVFETWIDVNEAIIGSIDVDEEIRSEDAE